MPLNLSFVLAKERCFARLHALAKEYNLSAGACALIRRFLELDEDIQQAFVDYAVQVANDLAQDQDAGDAAEQGKNQQ